MVVDPVKFCKEFWPEVELYDKQREIMYSVRDNDETIAVAGNQLGKDFVAALIILWYFLCHNPCKILTTSATERHLNTLWGEMDRFARTCKYQLAAAKGGCLLLGEQMVRRVSNGEVEKDSYIQRAVVTSTSKGEGLSGHHAPHTLFVCDEASAVPDIAHQMAQGWAKRMLIFGNPNPCNNFFFQGVKAGDLRAKNGAHPGLRNGHLYRKVIRIRAEDSPNVQLAQIQKQGNREITRETLIEGVLDYIEYCKRRETWDKVRQCIGLDAQFYEGAEVLLFPPEWLNRAEAIASKLPHRRQALAIGVDPAEGGDNTAWAVVDKQGLVELVSRKTPDTSVITGDTLALMKKYSVSPENIVFDAGGGGKEHADRLRRQGYEVRVVAFGASPASDKHRGRQPFVKREGESETRQVYKNRRAELYGTLHNLLDPINEEGFGIPAEYVELRRQLAPIPRWTTDEGKLELPPKQTRDVNSTKITLFDLIGCSPDEADALVLAVCGAFTEADYVLAKMY